VISTENQQENRTAVFGAVESLNGFQHALFSCLSHLKTILWLSRRRPRRRRGRGGGSPFGSRRRQLRSGADGFPGRVAGGGTRRACRGTRTRDNPSDRRGRRREGSPRQMGGCGRPAAGLRSTAQSAPTHRGTQGHRRC